MKEIVTTTPMDAAREMICAVQLRALQLSIPLRDPPPEPTTCCGRGCNGCVWDGYFAATAFWQEDALKALETPLNAPG